MAGCCGATGRTDPAEAKAEAQDQPRLRHAARLAAALAVPPAAAETRAALRAALAPVPGGIFGMGSRRPGHPADMDGPTRRVRVGGFGLGAATVTNAEFAAFVAATGYRTLAEEEGWSFVFHLLLPPGARHDSPPGLPWWRIVEGACWRAPRGPALPPAPEDHPVVHVSWYDALAYAHWAGLRLPREAEWERAARGGREGGRFAWGNTLEPGGAAQMNSFRGDFPGRHDAGAAWQGTVPARSFAANGYGLFNMTGNVWEWVGCRFGPLPAAGRLPMADPDRLEPAADPGPRLQRGGSYLCHASYCDRYQLHSRMGSAPENTAGNVGFRVAAG